MKGEETSGGGVGKKMGEVRSERREVGRVEVGCEKRGGGSGTRGKKRALDSELRARVQDPAFWF